MLRIVTDGAADILTEWGKDHGNDMIPANIFDCKEIMIDKLAISIAADLERGAVGLILYPIE